MLPQLAFPPTDFEAKANDAAALLRALSNAHRLLILCHLIAAGELSVGALVEKIGLSQSALSQHLAKLREERLVDFRREAQTVFYRVSDPRAGQVLAVLRDIFCPELGPGQATPDSGKSRISSLLAEPQKYALGE